MYFANAIDSVLRVASPDDLLVVDNASPDEAWRDHLRRDAARRGYHLTLRTTNDTTRNAKVGGLYDAYRAAFGWAEEHGYERVHVLQADSQVLWWDDAAVAEAEDIFGEHPTCMNVLTLALPRDVHDLSDDVEAVPATGRLRLRRYGLTDTGLFHLGRMRAMRIGFRASEREHAEAALRRGAEVVLQSVPSDAPIPWPAVMRGGRRVGREVPRTGDLLLHSVSPSRRDELAGRSPVALEDVCRPCGWRCLSPMLTTGVESIDYLVMRVRDARANGPRRLVPRYVGEAGARRPAASSLALGLGRAALRELLARAVGAAGRARVPRDGALSAGRGDPTA